MNEPLAAPTIEGTLSEREANKIRLLCLGVGIVVVVGVVLFDDNVIFRNVSFAVLAIGSFAVVFFALRFSKSLLNPLFLTILLRFLGFGIGSVTYLASETLDPFWTNTLYGLAVALFAASYWFRFLHARGTKEPVPTK